MNKVQQAIVALLGTEPFYAHLISRMLIRQERSIPTAGVYVTDKINMVYNPDWMESLELIDVVKVLKHECGHILQEHILRSKQIGAEKGQMQRRFNIATDATINVADLIPTVEKIGGVTVNKLNEQLKKLIDDANAKDNKNRQFSAMEKGQISEYYYNRLNEFADEHGDLLPESGMGETIDDHSVWEKSDGNDEILKEVIKNSVNEAVKSSGGIGNIPSDIASIINEMNRSQVNWKSQLRQFYVSTLKSSRVNTRKKRNRRYGILQPGNKKKPELHIGLCVDTSGSVSDEELSMFWAEMDAIYKCGVSITVIEADCYVQNVYKFEPNKTPTFKGRGGTAYNPALKKAVELNVDGIIYCGDFDISDTPENPKKPLLWVGVRNSPPPANFGKVIYLENV